MNQVLLAGQNYFQDSEWAKNISPEIQNSCNSILHASSAENPLYRFCQILTQDSSKELYHYLANQASSSTMILGESCLSVAKKLLDLELLETAFEKKDAGLFQKLIDGTNLLEEFDCFNFISKSAYKAYEAFARILAKECNLVYFKQNLGVAIMSGNLKYIQTYLSFDPKSELEKRSDILNVKITEHQNYNKTEFSAAFAAILFDQPEVLRELISLGLNTKEPISYKRTTFYNRHYFEYLHEGWFKPKKSDSSLFHDFGNEEYIESQDWLGNVYETPRSTIKATIFMNNSPGGYGRSFDDDTRVDLAKVEQSSPLFIAVQLNRQKIVEELAKQGDLNEQLELALYQACYLGHFQIAKTLIEAGASLDSVKEYVNIETLTQYLNDPKKYESELTKKVQDKIEVSNLNMAKSMENLQRKYLPPSNMPPPW